MNEVHIQIREYTHSLLMLTQESNMNDIDKAFFRLVGLHYQPHFDFRCLKKKPNS